jgi:uncharacterized oxidoreductase
VVGLRDSFHVGRIGHWAEQCAAAGLVSVHFVNVPNAAVVAPFGGTRARLGTNPFAAGFPRPGSDPVIVDFATSRWAFGKVRVASHRGEAVPPGTLLDADGRPTTDPAALFATPPGVLLPFGEHKGFGLGLACELLAGALLGGRTQDGTSDGAILNSMLSLLLSPEVLGTGPAFAASLEALAGWVRSADEPGRVRLPGEPESATRARRLRDGIPIDPVTWAEIQAAAGRCRPGREPGRRRARPTGRARVTCPSPASPPPEPGRRPGTAEGHDRGVRNGCRRHRAG